MEDKITQAMKFEIGDFADKCLERYKVEINESVARTYQDFYDRVQSEIKNKISKTVCGDDLYDYSKIDEPILATRSFGTMTPKVFLDKLLWQQNDLSKKIKSGFESLVPGEKIIIFKDSFQENTVMLDGFIITNYARCLAFTHLPGHGSYSPTNYQELNFWIPTDYIKIIKRILAPYQSWNSTYEAVMRMPLTHIIGVLNLIKDQLYDRKIVPLYSQDLVAENAALTAKHATYESDRASLDKSIAEFNQKKLHFEEYIKPYTDLEREKEEILAEKIKLNEERNNLRRIAQKIAIEREKLKKERELIEKVDLSAI